MIPADVVAIHVSTAIVIAVWPVAVVVVPVLLLVHCFPRLHLLHHQYLLLDYLRMLVCGGFSCLPVLIIFFCHLLVRLVLHLDLSL